MHIKKFHSIVVLVLNLLILLLIASCSKDDNSVVTNSEANNSNQQIASLEKKVSNAKQVNLVSDISSFSPLRIDPNLVNAWGISFNPIDNALWISSNGQGLAVVYDQNGNEKRSPITIPTVDNAPGGAPSGNVFNYTSDFRLPDGKRSQLIFVGEDGIVSAWGSTSGNAAVVVADQSAQQAVYKGVEIAKFKGRYHLYAANFKQNKIDVFDSKFNIVNFQFKDPSIPSDFAPFDIKEIDGKLFVTYAKQKGPDNMDDLAGPGNGFINVFSTGGVFLYRFASHGTLNSPWGLTLAEVSCGRSLLVGNFGDGHINIFNLRGKFLGQLKDQNSNTLIIDGLWGLLYLPLNHGKHSINKRVFFAAGPQGESHGLFGYLTVK